MTDYGVLPTGFSRKPLAIILAELEAANVTQFGPGVIQTSQSPLGQLNGLMADAINQVWERAEEIYNSYDPDQAEGIRLDVLGRIRLLSRAGGETDKDFRLAITNAGRARIDIQDLVRALRGLQGVTYAQVFLASDGNLDEFTVDPGTVAVAVIGGVDHVIAATMRDYIVPGISTFGNHVINAKVDGYCRELNLIRPTYVPVKLNITVRTFNDRLGCPPPSASDMKLALANYFAGKLVNGEDITLFKIRALESLFNTVEVINFNGKRDDIEQNTNAPVVIGFTEIATVALKDITIGFQ